MMDRQIFRSLLQIYANNVLIAEKLRMLGLTSNHEQATNNADANVAAIMAEFDRMREIEGRAQ